MREPPRISKEPKADIMPVARWFGEENFTYIIVFRSLASPHVFPYYVPNKILAKEIAYQTLGNGITKHLKYSKKSIWPIFPVQCGTFALFYIVDTSKEIPDITSLNLAFMPWR